MTNSRIICKHNNQIYKKKHRNRKYKYGFTLNVYSFVVCFLQSKYFSLDPQNSVCFSSFIFHCFYVQIHFIQVFELTIWIWHFECAITVSIWFDCILHEQIEKKNIKNITNWILINFLIFCFWIERMWIEYTETDMITKKNDDDDGNKENLINKIIIMSTSYLFSTLDIYNFYLHFNLCSKFGYILPYYFFLNFI